MEKICQHCGATIAEGTPRCRCGEIVRWENLPPGKRPLYKPQDRLGIALGMVFRSPDDLRRWERLLAEAGEERIARAVEKIPPQKRGARWTGYILAVVEQQIATENGKEVRDADFLCQ